MNSKFSVINILVWCCNRGKVHEKHDRRRILTVQRSNQTRAFPAYEDESLRFYSLNKWPNSSLHWFALYLICLDLNKYIWFQKKKKKSLTTSLYMSMSSTLKSWERNVVFVGFSRRKGGGTEHNKDGVTGWGHEGTSSRVRMWFQLF